MGRRDKGFHTPFAALANMKPVEAAREKPPARRPIEGESDSAVFLREVAGAVPMAARGPRVGAPPPARRPRAPVSDDAEVMASLADLVAGEGPFDISDTDEYVEGIAEGLDRRILKRLRAGEYAVQGHIDLHGKTRDEAREAVARFVGDSRRAGRRCVLIVHGRGNHSKDQIPVLKQSVRSWLERGQISRAVLAFTTARPHDGGAGAMYVLLRR
ncbi:MAG TPA: Smr/MutS family protein [Haliangiales bacterium]|nr:Smr/MutS family protein [Haliangiales bacterium]